MERFRLVWIRSRTCICNRPDCLCCGKNEYNDYCICRNERLCAVRFSLARLYQLFIESQAEHGYNLSPSIPVEINSKCCLHCSHR